MTSGFNIAADITKDENFNEMMGVTHEELIELMENQDIEKDEIENLLPIMKENYDGYKFSLKVERNLYNSNMCLYFLNEYIMHNKELPEKMIDVNIASDYEKIGRMLSLCKGEKKLEILEKTVSGEGILGDIVQKFNPAVDFEEKEMISMLYYLGYLTIEKEVFGSANLVIPNRVMRDI